MPIVPTRTAVHEAGHVVAHALVHGTGVLISASVIPDDHDDTAGRVIHHPLFAPGFQPDVYAGCDPADYLDPDDSHEAAVIAANVDCDGQLWRTALAAFAGAAAEQVVLGAAEHDRAERDRGRALDLLLFLSSDGTKCERELNDSHCSAVALLTERDHQAAVMAVASTLDRAGFLDGEHLRALLAEVLPDALLTRR